MTSVTRVHNRVNTPALGHPWSARADKLQSATGLMLGCFLLLHMHFESSILLGKEAFYHVVQFLEGGCSVVLAMVFL